MTVNRSKIRSSKSKLREAARTNSKRLHIIPSKGGWSVKKEGALRASKTFKNKQTAIAKAKSYMNSSGLIIVHKRDGTFQKIER